MKKLFFFGAVAACLTLSTIVTVKGFVPPKECFVQRFDCPGWGTGDKDTCIATGNSIKCTDCGASSECY